MTTKNEEDNRICAAENEGREREDCTPSENESYKMRSRINEKSGIREGDTLFLERTIVIPLIVRH